MYSFSKGQSRLFVKGSRQVDDNDNITDPADTQVTSHSRLSHRDHGVTSAELSSSSKFESKSQMASASQESRELLRTNNVRSGLKTVHTQKVVRKTTTISLGEKKESTHVKVRHESEAGEETPVLTRSKRQGNMWLCRECGRPVPCSLLTAIIDAADTQNSPTHRRGDDSASFGSRIA